MSALTKPDLQRIFEKLDKNGDNHVSIEELYWPLEKLGFELGLHELESTLGKQCLNFDEFCSFYDTISQNNKGEEEELRNDSGGDPDLFKAFRVFDTNGDGFITSEELEKVLFRLGLLDGRDCKSMIQVFDTNLDGLLDFEEFKNMMMKMKL